jgi:hypothetical protein
MEPWDAVLVFMLADAASVPEMVKPLLPAVRCTDGGGGNVDGFGRRSQGESRPRGRV